MDVPIECCANSFQRSMCIFGSKCITRFTSERRDNDVVRQMGNMREAGVATNLRNMVLLSKWEMWSVFQLGLGINGK
jgi:hypothetical protein